MIRAGLVALCLASPAMAQDRPCVARVDHLDVVIAPGVVDAAPGAAERIARWPGALWDRAWGRPATCDSATTIAFLAAVEAVEDIDGLCLAEAADDGGWLLVPGERNWRGRCRRTVCDRINAAAADGAAIAGIVTSVATGRQVGSLGEGVTAVASTSGAMMLTGQAPALFTLLGEGATAAGAALSAPAVAGAAAVTVLAVGGAVYVCRD